MPKLIQDKTGPLVKMVDSPKNIFLAASLSAKQVALWKIDYWRWPRGYLGLDKLDQNTDSSL